MKHQTYSVIISTIKGREKALKNLLLSIKRYSDNPEIIIHDDSKGSSIPVAEAWNNCAKKSTGKYLIFLNDDMEVTEGWLTSMKSLYESLPLVGSLAFKVYDDQGQIQSRGHSFAGLQPYLPDEPEDMGVGDQIMEIDYSDHPFVSRKLWGRVGGFPVYGKLYYEDAGFGLRLQSAGFRNYYNPKAVLKHNTIGLRVGTDEDKRRRKHNEEVIQQESKVNFYKEWSSYLVLRKG